MRTSYYPLILVLLLGVGGRGLAGAQAGAAGGAAAPDRLPQSDRAVPVRVAGEALETVLPRLGQELGVSWRPSRELAPQRVTLYLKQANATRIARLLADLLSGPPDQPEQGKVLWVRQGEAWVLEQDARRRRYATERLQGQATRLLAFAREQSEWLTEWERKEADAPPGQPPKSEFSPLTHSRRLAGASLMRSFGPQDWARLLAGEVISFQFGRMKPDLRARFRDCFKMASSRFRDMPEGELDQQHVAFLIAGPPGGGFGQQIYMMNINERGQGHLGMNLVRPPAGFTPGLSLEPTPQYPPPPPMPGERKISFIVAPRQNPKPGEQVERTPDTYLADLAAGSEYEVVADGYLRHGCWFPPNYPVRDFPIAHLFRIFLKGQWGCTWRLVAGEERTLLVRAEDWWWEDVADVPQATYERHRKALGPGAHPTLDDLIRFAELPLVQMNKLLVARYRDFPGASGMQGFEQSTDIWARTVLRFLGRLSLPQRNQALGEGGLRLADAPEGVVRAELERTLVCSGAVTPEFRAGLRVSVVPMHAPGMVPGWSIVLTNGQPGSLYRKWFVGPQYYPRHLPTGEVTTR